MIKRSTISSTAVEHADKTLVPSQPVELSCSAPIVVEAELSVKVASSEVRCGSTEQSDPNSVAPQKSKEVMCSERCYPDIDFPRNTDTNKVGGLSSHDNEITPLVNPETGRYYGDDLDETSLPPKEGYGNKIESLQFESALELICFFDTAIRSGTVVPHPWQVEVLEELSFTKATSNKPHRFALRAANGSGKDSYIVCPFVVWFALTKVRALTIITSSSGVQLTAQTENYIAALCHKINTYVIENGISETPVFKVNKRFIKCLLTGSEIRMFATDEAGKAEGYHPLEPGAEMLIVVNEAKTVSHLIFEALERCTGYNFWLNVSTPGEPRGDFYDSCNDPEFWHTRKVSAYDCTHLSIDDIRMAEKKHGPNSFIFRSKVLAEFTTIGGTGVISEVYLNRLVEGIKNGIVKKVTKGRKRLSADLAAGRDECVFWAVQGNAIIEVEFFVEKDTTETEERFYQFWLKHGGNEECDIIADDGGLGHAIIDRLVKRGVNVRRMLNQSRAIDTNQFGNRGAEMWYNLARLIEEGAIYIEPKYLNIKQSHDGMERTLMRQLISRHYKKSETQGKITLVSKPQEKEEFGVKCSPDKADALVLAFADYKFDEYLSDVNQVDSNKPDSYTIEELMGAKFVNMRKAMINDGTENARYGLSSEAMLNNR